MCNLYTYKLSRDEIRGLMQEWADFCENGDKQSDNNVVPIRA